MATPTPGHLIGMGLAILGTAIPFSVAVYVHSVWWLILFALLVIGVIAMMREMIEKN